MAELLVKGIVFKYFNGNTAVWIVGVFLTLVIGYLLGGLNFGIIISKLFYGDDIRNYGSKNAGMTNMLRTYGIKAAVFTFIGDALKTVIAAFIGMLILGVHLNTYPCGYYGNYICAFGSVLGHVFPCYYKFKGGKGVTAALFLVLCTEPVIAVALLLLFIGLVWGTKYISVGSIMCIMIYPLLLQRFTGSGLHIIIAMLLAGFIVFLHRGNLKRLLSGTENKLDLNSLRREKSKGKNKEKAAKKK